MGAELTNISYFRGIEQHLPSGNINVAGDTHKGHECPVIVRTIDLLFNGHAPLDGCGPGGSKEPCCLPDFFRRNPRDLFHFIQRIFVYPFNKRFPSMDMIFHKFPVIQFFIDNNVKHPQGECRICPGSKLKPDIRTGGNPRKPRVNRDKFCPFVYAYRKRFALVTVRVTDYQVIAPYHNTFGMVFVINDRICSAGQNTCGNTGAIAKMTGSKDIGGA